MNHKPLKTWGELAGLLACVGVMVLSLALAMGGA